MTVAIQSQRIANSIEILQFFPSNVRQVTTVLTTNNFALCKRASRFEHSCDYNDDKNYGRDGDLKKMTCNSNTDQ